MPVLLHSFTVLAWPLWHFSLQTVAQVKDLLAPSRSLKPVVPELPSRGRHHSASKNTRGVFLGTL